MVCELAQPYGRNILNLGALEGKWRYRVSRLHPSREDESQVFGVCSACQQKVIRTWETLLDSQEPRSKQSEPEMRTCLRFHQAQWPKDLCSIILNSTVAPVICHRLLQPSASTGGTTEMVLRSRVCACVFVFVCVIQKTMGKREFCSS